MISIVIKRFSSDVMDDGGIAIGKDYGLQFRDNFRHMELFA